MDMDFQPLGDMGIRVQFNERVSPELNRKIQSFCKKIVSERIKGIIECVPAYDSVAIYYSPNQLTYHSLCKELANLSTHDSQDEEEQRSLMFIPTFYGGETGPDLENVARHNHITEQDVIDIHSGTDYLIHMMGFLPGFPYMGGLSDSITTPRLETPRTEVPGGTVGIAGEQTVIYSMKSPGGANLIGCTPIQLFDMSQEDPFLFQPGDMVRFESVSEEEYKSIKQQIENKTYKVKKEVIQCLREEELI
jgi:inhibitor of KinA